MKLRKIRKYIDAYKNFRLRKKGVYLRGDGVLLIRKDCNYSLHLPLEFADHSGQKVAALIHIFYIDLCLDIKNYLDNIPCLVDVFISTDSEEKRLYIEEIFRDFEKGQLVVRVFPNIGRDIAPMLIGFTDVYDQYENFLHIHSKKSNHNPILVDWRDYSYKALLGSKEIVRSILYILENNNIGLIYPQHFPKVRECIDWGGNYDTASKLFASANIARDSLAEFPSGSMFWAKSAAIKPLLDLNLQWNDFPKENGQTDGTLAHAIERLFLYSTELAGFKWMKVSVEPEEYGVVCRNQASMSTAIDKIYKSVLKKY